MSPCNCGGKKSSYSYSYTAPNGQTKVYSTEVEARAAQIRNGGKGTITTMPR